MSEDAFKWFFIAAGIVVAAPMVAMAVDSYSQNNARRDIIVACYRAGNNNCHTLWNKEILK